MSRAEWGLPVPSLSRRSKRKLDIPHYRLKSLNPESKCIFQVVMAHLSIMVMAGIITVLCVRFLRRVKPEILEVVYER